jgi:APA family basic amino acid/polyamine antiporter
MAEDLKQTLSWLDAASVVVGIVIGAGIFVTPQELARLLPATGAMTLAWIVSGLLVFCGALAFAELSAMLPATGGLYVYLKEAFGPAVAFSSGWVHLFALLSGATAYVASGFSRYLAALAPVPEGSELLTTLLLIWGLALLAALSTRWAVRLQNVTNVAKILALLVLIALAFFADSPAQNAPQTVVAGNFGLALATCFFCYEGWSYAGFVAGEMRQPARDLPRAFAISFLVVVVLYLAVNLAYTRVLSIGELQQSGQVGADVARRVLGPAGGQALAAVIVLAIIGTVNGLGLAASRLYYAQARDGLFLPGLNVLHRGTGTPVRAIVAHAAVSSLLVVFSSSLGFVLQLAISAAWLYYAVAVVGLMRLRARRPQMPRPYRMWGYPWTPALFIAGTLGFLISLTIQSPWPSVSVLAVVAVSFPMHSWVARANARI